MNIPIFTLCEFAQTINGKTNIIGTFNRIAPPSFPYLMPDIYVVVKLSTLQDIDDVISITLREKGGPDIISTGEQQLKVKRVNDREAIHDIVLRINQVSFPKPGQYEVVFRVGKKEYSTNLYVDEAK